MTTLNVEINADRNFHGYYDRIFDLYLFSDYFFTTLIL